MQQRQRRTGAALALLGAGALAALVSAGCGSSSTDATARISSIDLSPNAATAGILVNGAANGGDLTFGEKSGYNFIGQGVSTFGFTTTATTSTTGTLPPSPTLQLNNGSAYTTYLIGRSDTASLSDARFLQTIVTGNKGAAANYTEAAPYADPPSGQANVRIVNGAPDAGFSGTTRGAVDVLINGQPAFTSVEYPAFPTRAAVADTSAPAVTPATTYQAFSAGTLSVQVNLAGTATVLVPPTNVSVSGGKAYTIVVTEPTAAPTYGLYANNDQP